MGLRSFGEYNGMRVKIGRVFRLEVKTLDKYKIETSARKFIKFIEEKKDPLAYSDFKEGVNKGLDIAKNTFEENAEKFCLLDTAGDQTAKKECLHDDFCQLIDTIVMAKKPNWSDDHFKGLSTGFERSKEIFREFIEASFPQGDT